MPAKPVLYLIDGSSQMYRAYHAPVRTADGGLLRNAQGTPTNAVYIFVTMLRKLLNEHRPEFIAASFDLPGRTFRDDLVADYKANRAPMPDELAQQIPMVHAACEALGVPILTSERYEADDVIGTLAEKAAAAGFEVAIDAEAVRYRGGSRYACFRIFNELGFRAFAKEYAPDAKTTAKTYRTVLDDAALRQLAERLRAAGRFAVRVLPDRPTAMLASIVGIAFSTAPREADYVPVGHRSLAAPTLPLEAVLDALRPVLEDEALAKIGHDLKFDAIVLARHGITLRGLETDTMLASFLLDSSRAEHRLEDLALEHTSYKALSEEDVCGRGVKALSLADVPIEAALDYAGERADLVGQLAPRFRELLDQEQLTAVYDTIERPLIPVLIAMERAGVRLDGTALAAQSQKIEQDLSQRTAQIYEVAGGEFNINSPKQLSEILFDKLQLPVLKRTGTSRAPSTAVDVLEELALTHDLPRQILEWRALMKLKGTYIDALPQLVNPETGRVHTCLNQAGAATGRLSSSDPNLQNIPIKTALGREIRRAFVADPDHVLISADYSQIEFRVLAHMSEDSVLVDAFREGADFHERTATKIFGANSGKDPHQLRSIAKMVNYALLYGKSAFTLSKDIGVSQQEAQTFIDGYFAGFPRVRGFIDRTLADARATGVVKTIYGRRRLVPDLNSRNGQLRMAAERMAVNMPIQGTAADIMKRAMIDVHAALGTHPDARMILTVHDELLFEVPKTRADEISAVVRDVMQGAAALNVPLTVDIGVGA